jgi:hypothetical protein
MAGGGGTQSRTLTQTPQTTRQLNQGFNTPSQAPPLPVPGQEQITDAVLGGLEPHSFDAIGGAPNPFVGAGPQQQAAMNQMFGYSQAADPFFGQGLAQQQGTVAGQYFNTPTIQGQYQKTPTIQGQYLDPSTSAAFQQMANARLGFARQMFGQFAPQQSGQAVAAGVPYSSSARLAEVQRGGERIGTQAAQDIAQAGWGQYARERELQEAAYARERALQEAAYGGERGFQEAAAKYGTQLAPGLAQQVFAQNETLRGAEQGANQFQIGEDTKRDIANLDAQMRAEGFDEASIKNAIDFMRNQQAATVTGPTPGQTLLDYLRGAATLGQGVGAGDLISSLFRGSGQTESQPPAGQGAQVAAFHDQGLPSPVVPASSSVAVTPNSPLAAPDWMLPDRSLYDAGPF